MDEVFLGEGKAFIKIKSAGNFNAPALRCGLPFLYAKLRFASEFLCLEVATSFVVIVVAALHDVDASVLDFVDETILFIDGAAPPCREIAFQRLWMSESIVAIALDVGKQAVYFLQRLFVLCLPVEVIIPACVCPNFFHGYAFISSCSVHFSLPSLSSATIFSKYRWFASL